MGMILVVLGIALAIWTIFTASRTSPLRKPIAWSQHPVLVPGVFLAVSLAIILLGLSM